MHDVVLDGGIALSYTERGVPGREAVVLLPGPTDSWRSYEPVLASVPNLLRVVAVSLRGHGDSSKPASGYRIENLASDVVPFLDALGIDRAVLAGHSGSCLVARRVALDAPARVAGLFLEASPTTLRGNPRFRQFVDGIAELTDPVDEEFARSFVVDTSTENLSPEQVERFVDDVRKVPAGAWHEMFASLRDYDDTTELAKVMTPAMLVWGDADQLVPREMQDQLVRLLINVELVVYPGAGHAPRLEQPDRFASDLAKFASRMLN